MKYVKIEEMDDGSAYLLTYFRDGIGEHRAYGSFDRAIEFGKLLINVDIVEKKKQFGPRTWYAEGE